MTAIAIDPRFTVSSELSATKVLGGRPLPAFSAEVLALPARLLLELPLPPRLGLHVPGVQGIVRIGVGGGADGDLCFGAEEWRALVVATEADRVWPSDFKYFCQRKAGSNYALDVVEALAGAQPDPAERWTVQSVLERLGVGLLSIDLE